MAPFAGTASPLGPGPIEFDTGSGADFASRAISSSPAGTLSVQEDLTALSFSGSADTVLHVTCASGCEASRIRIRMTAVSSASAADGWPYPSVGLASCLLAGAAQLTVPHGAITAMFGADASLNTVTTEVVRLPAQPTQTTDVSGNPLVVETGQGVFGVSQLTP